MHEALYDEQRGYYQKPGRQHPRGDYITSPTLLPLFSQCITKHIIPMLRTYPDWCLLEFGPGDGQMAMDILTYLHAHRITRPLYLIEPNAHKVPYLKNALRTHLPRSLWSFVHVDIAPPGHFQGIVLANEVLDAMPVHLLQTDAHRQAMELSVARDAHGHCAWVSQPAPDTLIRTLKNRNIPLHPNYRYELSTTILPWLESWSHNFKQGIALFFDYGYSRAQYYHPERHLGTLTAFKNHQQVSNVLACMGEQDLSVHVDFTLLAENLEIAGMHVQSFMPQGPFLLQCGLESLLADACDSLSDKQRRALTQNVKTLIHPGEMGERMQVMVASKHCTYTPFQMFDQRHTL